MLRHKNRTSPYTYKDDTRTIKLSSQGLILMIVFLAFSVVGGFIFSDLKDESSLSATQAGLNDGISSGSRGVEKDLKTETAGAAELASASLTTQAGRVKEKQDASTQPKFKEFTNKNYGLNFQYPSDWKVLADEDSEGALIVNALDEKYQLTLRLYPNPQRLKLDQFFSASSIVQGEGQVDPSFSQLLWRGGWAPEDELVLAGESAPLFREEEKTRYELESPGFQLTLVLEKILSAASFEDDYILVAEISPRPKHDYQALAYNFALENFSWEDRSSSEALSRTQKYLLKLSRDEEREISVRQTRDLDGSTLFVLNGFKLTPEEEKEIRQMLASIELGSY